MNNEKVEFNQPSNIKQMGVINDDFKVYIEDYAATFINQYARESGCEERIAVLLGNSCKIDGKMTTFINGVIKDEYSEEENGRKIFSEKSWEYIKQQREKYFKGLEIVGWLYIQPGYGDMLNAGQQEYHYKVFENKAQVLLISDPLEKVNTFFIRATEESQEPLMKALGGYIVYYDKNESMNKYMTENRTIKIDTDEAAQQQKNNDEKLRRAAMKALTDKKVQKKKKPTKTINISEQKKLINLFGTLSAILFVVCFVMGAGLVENDGRISKIEQQLLSITDSYKYIASKLTEDNAQAVFADSADDIQTVTTEIQTQTTTEISTQTPTQKADSDVYARTEYKPKKYTVIKGDSLDKISRKIYGDSSMVYAIMEENEIEDINCIRIGDVLILPEEVTK